MGSPDAGPADALEDIAYLARSTNRVRLLDALASGAYTRRDLDELTGVARTTIGRIVSEFEDRGWVERTTDGEYTATPTGKQVAAEFTPLVESMEAIQKLGDLVAWFQAAEQSISLHHLSDATVRQPEQDDPMEIIDFFIDLIQDTSEFHTLNHLAPAIAFEEILRDRLVTDRLSVTCVFTGDLVDYLYERPKRRERWHDCIAAGAAVYRFDGVVPCNLLILDATVYIAKSQAEYGEPYTMIESENDAVRSWAHKLIEAHKANSKHLDAEAFIEDPTTTGADSQY